MKKIIDYMLKLLLSYPIAVEFDHKTIRQGTQLILPENCIGSSFSNLGEPCTINGIVVPTNGVLASQLSVFERDVTQYTIQFNSPTPLGPNLVVTYKLKYTPQKDT